jgi:hypothetical protein
MSVGEGVGRLVMFLPVLHENQGWVGNSVVPIPDGCIPGKGKLN